MKANLKKYVKERDAMLKKCDVQALRQFVNDHRELYSAEYVAEFNAASDEVLKVALHKMIVNARKLPAALKNKSAAWLIFHGYDLNIR